MEWSVFLVICALLSFAAAIITPVVKLNTSITRLTVTMEDTAEKLKNLTLENATSHQHMSDRMESSESRLANHDIRITVLEHEGN